MFPHLRVQGDPRSRGYQYGQQAAVRIARSVEGYTTLFAHFAGWDWQQARREARAFEEPIGDLYPQYLEEMKGIADGAGLELPDILALNARTEIMYAPGVREMPQRPPPVWEECTAIFATDPTSGRVVIGQNWDWALHAYDTVVVVETIQDGGPNYVTVVEAGLLAKAGLNAHGIGVVTNGLTCTDDKGGPGLPCHVLLRALLDAPDPAACLGVLKRGDRASSANYLFADSSGLAMDVETVPGGGDGVFVTRPDPPDRHLAHTNHFTHPGFNGIDVELDVGPGSFLRLRRAEELLRRRDRSVESYLEDIFRDHEGLPTSICAHGDEASPPPERVATVFSVVMDPDARTLRIADGSPCETPYRTVDYSDLLAPSTVA